MDDTGINSKDWASKYHYREAGAVNSCDLCSYANRIDIDHDKRVESLTCSAGSKDTGGAFPVDFGSICDLFLPEMMGDDDD